MRAGDEAPRGGAAFRLRPIGVIRSALVTRAEAPRQGDEGAPDAWLHVEPWALLGLRGGPGHSGGTADRRAGTGTSLNRVRYSPCDRRAVARSASSGA
jgi:hypothetical protein